VRVVVAVPSVEYTRRSPDGSVLYQVVQRELSLTVTLPEGTGAIAQGPITPAAAEIPERIFRVDYRDSVTQLQGRQLSQILGEVQAGLALLLGAVQAPGPPPARKAPARKRRLR
jgi:hypothetical protein